MSLLVTAAAELGFRKRAGFVFTRGDGAHCGWLGLNTASRGGAVGQIVLNPVVGVRHLDIEGWVSRGRGEKLHPYLPPTCSEPLRYLLPAERREDWILDGSGSDPQVAEKLMSVLATAGLAFLDELGDLTAVSRVLAARAHRDQQAAYRWPVSLLLSGQPEAAMGAAEEVRASLKQRQDRAALELRGFLDWFEREVRARG